MILRFLLNNTLMFIIWHFNIVDFFDKNAHFAQKVRDFYPQIAESLWNLLLEFNCAFVFAAHVLKMRLIERKSGVLLFIFGALFALLTVEMNSGSICASAWSKLFRNLTFVFSAKPRSRKRTVASEIMRWRPPGRITKIEESSNLQPWRVVKICLTFDQLASLRSISTANGAAEFELQI